MRRPRLRVALRRSPSWHCCRSPPRRSRRATAPRHEHERIVAYWTKERIANAIPRDFVKAGGGAARPIRKPRAGQPPTGGGARHRRVLDRQVGRSCARSGRVLFTMGGGDWICSGTSVSDGGRAGYSMVLTAGHCAIDETNGQFATQLDVHPGLRHGADVHLLGVGLRLLDGRRRWPSTTEFATAGSFNDQAVTNDWAFAIVGPGGKSGTAQLDSIGRRPIRSRSRASRPGNKLYAFGYPAAGKYHGRDLVYCAGNIIQDTRHREPDLGDGLQHDRRLVGRAVAVGLRRIDRGRHAQFGELVRLRRPERDVRPEVQHPHVRPRTPPPGRRPRTSR